MLRSEPFNFEKLKGMSGVYNPDLEEFERYDPPEFLLLINNMLTYQTGPIFTGETESTTRKMGFFFEMVSFDPQNFQFFKFPNMELVDARYNNGSRLSDGILAYQQPFLFRMHRKPVVTTKGITLQGIINEYNIPTQTLGDPKQATLMFNQGPTYKQMCKLQIIYNIISPKDRELHSEI